MKDYYSFDVDAFFRDYASNKRKLRELEIEYNSIIDNMSQSNDSIRVVGGLPKSVVETKAEQRDKVMSNISDIKEYFNTVNHIKSQLNSTDNRIIDSYFIKRKKSRAEVEILANELYMSSSTLYRRIKKLRRAVREIVSEL